jgi:hypothetical protein
MRLIHKLIALLLHRFTQFRVIAWDGRGRIAGIGKPIGGHASPARIGPKGW